MDSRANAKEFVVRLHEVAEAAETGSPMPSETGQLHTFLTSESLSMVPLVQAHLAESALATPASATAGLGVKPDSPLRSFYFIDAQETRMEELARRMIELPEVAGAYVKPAAELPVAPAYDEVDIGELQRGLKPMAHVPNPASPDLQHLQGYLDPAPAGVDARHGWTIAGGRGDGVKVVDVEGGLAL